MWKVNKFYKMDEYRDNKFDKFLDRRIFFYQLSLPCDRLAWRSWHHCDARDIIDATTACVRHIIIIDKGDNVEFIQSMLSFRGFFTQKLWVHDWKLRNCIWILENSIMHSWSIHVISSVCWSYVLFSINQFASYRNCVEKGLREKVKLYFWVWTLVTIKIFSFLCL